MTCPKCYAHHVHVEECLTDSKDWNSHCDNSTDVILCSRHAILERLLEALREVRVAIKDSIDRKLSMNNLKYDGIGQQVVKLLKEYDQLEGRAAK